jgi:hypothetical protein
MTGRPLALIALFCAGMVAACGGSGTQASNPRQVMLTAAHLTEAQSFRMDASGQESFSGSGSISGQLGPLGALSPFISAERAEFWPRFKQRVASW